MYKILTLNKISKIGLGELDKSKYTYGEEISSPDAILVRSASMHEMELDEKTVAVARAGAGVNNIPISDFAKKGVVVFNTPGANANAVKELVLCALFMSSRKVAESIDWCKGLKGEGDSVSKLVEKGKSSFAGPEIFGKTLGVVGMGAIGALVANGASALGMKIIGYDPLLSDETKKTFENLGYIITEDLDDIYSECDYITLHLPLNDATRDMINSESIAKMKDLVRILNFARGELVDYASVIAALDSGKVGAYATDFPTDELIDHEGVIAIPHLGASTPESEDNCAVMAANQVARYLEKGEIVNSVNYPDTGDLPNYYINRTCILFNEATNPTEACKNAAKSQAAVINNIFTATKKGMGYTVIDSDKPLDLSSVEAIIKIRKI